MCIYIERATKIFNISCCFNKGTYLIKMTWLLLFFFNLVFGKNNFHNAEACIAEKQFQYTIFIM